MSLLSAFLEMMATDSLSTATWNPSDKSAAITLSGASLVATKDAVDAYNGVRATAAVPAGSKCFGSFTVGAVGPATTLGLANTSASLSAFAGADLNAVAYQSTGNVFINGATVATYATYTTGSKVDWAYDDTAKLFWVRVDGGNWNNSGAANPATGAGGLSTVSLNAGPYLPIFSGRASSAVTANFGGSAFTYPPPSGFGTIP